MKTNKILALVLAVAMIMSTMGIVASASGNTLIVDATNQGSYATVEAAMDAAVSGDTIRLTAGEYEAFTVSKEGLTFEGTVDTDGNNLTTIKTLCDTAATANGGVDLMCGGITTFRNLDFTAGTVTTNIWSSVIGFKNELNTKNPSIVVENCEFQGSGVGFAAYMPGSGSETFTNCVINNFARGIGGDAVSGNISATKTTITNCVYPAHAGTAYVNNMSFTIENSNVSGGACHFGSGVNVEFSEKTTLSNVEIGAYGDAAITISESFIEDCTVESSTTADSITITNSYASNEFMNSYADAIDSDNSSAITEIVAIANGKPYAKIQDAVDAAEIGTTEILLQPGTIDENVILYQVKDKNIVIKGSDDVIYTGYFHICGNNRYDADETITFDGINFVKTDKSAKHDFIESTRREYSDKTLVWGVPHNVTVQNCTFTGNYVNQTDEEYEGKEVVALRNVGGYNWTVKNCTATNLHSFMQASANYTDVNKPGRDFASEIDGVTLTNSKSGLNLGTNANYTITNSTFDVVEYAIRTDANSDRDVDLVIKECNFTGENALVVRKADSAKFTYDVVMNNNKIVTTGAGIVRKNGTDADTISFDFGFNYWNGGEAKVEGLSEASIVASLPYYTDEDMTIIGGSEAKIGDVYYATIQEAIEEAKAVASPVIELFAGTYNGFDVPAELNNVTFVGETDAEGNNLVTIKTFELGLESHNGGIFVQPETSTFKNLNFTAGVIDVDAYYDGDGTDYPAGWMSSSLGNTNGDMGMGSSLKNLTVENCNFVGSGIGHAIWTNQGNVTVKNSTITNYAIGISDYSIEANQKLIIEKTEITEADIAFQTSSYGQEGSEIIVKESKIDSNKIDVEHAAKVSIEKSEIHNAVLTTYNDKADVKVSDTSFINGVISEASKGTYNNVKIEVDADGNSTYDAAIAAVAANNEINANIITVKFEQTMKNGKWVEGSYDINLYGNGDGIYEFASAEFTFDTSESLVASGESTMHYTVKGLNGVEVIKNPERNDANADDVVTLGFFATNNPKLNEKLSGEKVTIGNIVFDGKGDIKLDVTDGYVVATKYDTFDEAEYTTKTDAVYKLNLGTGITGDEVALDTRDVVINIEFEHDIDADNSADEMAYKAITVTLKDSIGETYNGIIDVKDANKAVVTFDKEVLCGVITVTLKADGFRTYTYQTTFEDAESDFVLNFWNSVKRGKTLYIEEGNDRSKMAHNFLVGDIAMDYIIDKYDLAAVTSYYGNYDIKTGDKYVRYDLNRDHQIDILDVAYVLHGMGN